MKKFLQRLSFDHLMGLLILLGVIFVFCNTGCNAQISNNVPAMEYYDASGEDFDYPGIIFYADGIVDFVYCTQDNEFVIEYNDPDAFDVDNIVQTISCVSGDSNYVSLYCSEAVFFECLNWYSGLCSKDEEFYSASKRFYIEEVFVGDDDYDSLGYSYYRLMTR